MRISFVHTCLLFYRHSGESKSGGLSGVERRQDRNGTDDEVSFSLDLLLLILFLSNLLFSILFLLVVCWH